MWSKHTISSKFGRQRYSSMSRRVGNNQKKPSTYNLKFNFFSWVPIYQDADQKLAVMSIGFLLKNRDDAVVWRGPKKTAMIKQFLTDVYWQDIDYLIIDTPPGTSDEHITVMENLKTTVKCDGAVIVTSPQEVAIEDVRKEVTFCRKTGIPILGIIENMSG